MLKKPIAIRSLRCPDHAINIPPQILDVIWFVGKRCNYDCSYCSPHVHDSVSPFLDITQSLRFAKEIHDYCAKNGRRVNWAFTGGEPFLDPGFLDLSDYIRACDTTEQMNVITNGSLSVEMYQKAANIFKGITFSLHLERSQQELDSIIDKLPQISNQCYVSVNLMFLPGRLQQIKKIIKKLEYQGTPYVLRKITPVIDDVQNLPYETHGTGRKNKVLKSINQQSYNKIQYREKNDELRADLIEKFYDHDEKEYLAISNHKVEWQNCGVWFDDGSYKEINSDDLLAKDLTNFKDWICFAGVDNIFVDFDGKIYRAQCQNAGAIGHISDGPIFKTTPTRCLKQWCTCNADIPVRKSLPSRVTLIGG